MKYLFMLVVTVMLFTGCSSNRKVINGKPQTFTEYVLLNKYSDNSSTDNKFNDFRNLSEDAFPVNRYIKWKEAKGIER